MSDAPRPSPTRNTFLMGYPPRFEVCGLTMPIYNERIRTVEWQPGAH
jgi:hypothetical protein